MQTETVKLPTISLLPDAFDYAKDLVKRLRESFDTYGRVVFEQAGVEHDGMTPVVDSVITHVFIAILMEYHMTPEPEDFGDLCERVAQTILDSFEQFKVKQN